MGAVLKFIVLNKKMAKFYFFIYSVSSGLDHNNVHFSSFPFGKKRRRSSIKSPKKEISTSNPTTTGYIFCFLFILYLLNKNTQYIFSFPINYNFKNTLLIALFLEYNTSGYRSNSNMRNIKQT